MDKQQIQTEIDTRTLEGLLDDLKEVHQRLGEQLEKLDLAPRLSEPYHTMMPWLHGLSSDVQTEMDRVDDQIPDDGDP